jgi:hypothetical protein
LYPAFHKEKGGDEFLPYIPPASRRLSRCWLAGKASRLDAKAVPKIMGKFLKTCGSQVQVSCPFSPLLGFSHWKAKMEWLCGAR